MKAFLADIVIGGTGTTSTAFEWTMAELMKAQQELIQVVGAINTVEEYHIHQLPYLQAVVKKDPQFWDNPDEFQPERFVGDGNKLDFSGNNLHYIPFGSGRRICAGLRLGERMLMYVLATFLHMFHWQVPDGGKPDTEEKFGIVLEKSTPLIVIPTPRFKSIDLYD
ncbi:hypothetical protein PTKIN_Ptkin01aG0260300 [Pterospermum kingtungense]